MELAASFFAVGYVFFVGEHSPWCAILWSPRNQSLSSVELSPYSMPRQS